MTISHFLFRSIHTIEYNSYPPDTTDFSIKNNISGLKPGRHRKLLILFSLGKSEQMGDGKKYFQFLFAFLTVTCMFLLSWFFGPCLPQTVRQPNDAERVGKENFS